MIKNDTKYKFNLFVKNFAFLAFFFFFLSIFTLKSSKIDNFSKFYKKNSFSIIENQSFQCGELLKYKISYGAQNKRGGVLLAAHAYLKAEKFKLNNEKTVYRLFGSGRTTNLFSLFFKVKHSYTSFINPTNMKTIKCSMKIKEGRYHKEEKTTFSKQENTNDVLGSFYKLRTISQEKLIKQDTVFFSYYYGGKTYNSYFINHGEEVLEIKFGNIKTIKCEPLLEKGRIFDSQKGAYVWITSDKMHIPIKLEIPILVGSLYVNLVSYENTVFDLNE
mgnify:CR=1 FL=1